MLRRTRARLGDSWTYGKNPEIHRHAQSTFHKEGGVHREPPAPERTPWTDTMSPWGLAKVFNKKPNAMTYHIILSVSLSIVTYYAYCVSWDVKSHYVMNNTLQRELIIQRAKADELEARAKQLEDALTTQISPSGEKKLKDAAATDVDDSVANYEIVLAKERQRSSELHRQHQALVFELADVRADNIALRKQVEKSETEIGHLRNQLDRMYRGVETAKA